LFGSVRQIKLAVYWLLGARKSEIVEVEVEVDRWTRQDSSFWASSKDAFRKNQATIARAPLFSSDCQQQFNVLMQSLSMNIRHQHPPENDV